MEASPWYEAAANLACQLLAEQTQAAPKVHAPQLCLPVSDDQAAKQERWGMAAVALVTLTSGNPLLQDSLQQAGSLVRAVLPEGHIIASRMEKLVEANRSAQTQSRLKQQEERLQVHCFTLC